MKVRTLQRPSIQRECVGDPHPQSRNLDPQYHPMQRAREYARAVTAAKISRMFAKPLVGNLGHGHRDAVTCSALCRRNLLPLVSGAADGVVQLWDLATRTSMAELEDAHSRLVTGVCFDANGENFYSCSEDGTVKKWSLHPVAQRQQTESDAKLPAHTAKRSSKVAPSTTQLSLSSPSHGPLMTWRCNGSFKSIDHHWREQLFATASDDAIQIWHPDRGAAIQTHRHLWESDDTVTCVRFHPAEHDLLAHCSADRGVGLHDARTGAALRKTILSMRCNDLQWNPMEPMNFLVANEDYNCYLFDMRKLDQPVRLYKGHTNSVMSVAWSSTGREFVTGSYDRTMRIFELRGGAARDIYHTKRMQRVMTVQYTMDSKYVISGSDDTNLRLWKAQASAKLGQLSRAEEQAMEYRQALVQRYQHTPSVRHIVKHRRVPKTIQKQTQQSIIHKEAQDRKQANRVKYDRTGEHKFSSERKKAVVKEVK